MEDSLNSNVGSNVVTGNPFQDSSSSSPVNPAVQSTSDSGASYGSGVSSVPSSNVSQPLPDLVSKSDGVTPAASVPTVQPSSDQATSSSSSTDQAIHSSIAQPQGSQQPLVTDLGTSTANPAVSDPLLTVKKVPEDLDLQWARWRCLECNYVYEGEKKVSACPRCGNTDPDKFEDAE